jgi:hypothetical protein
MEFELDHAVRALMSRVHDLRLAEGGKKGAVLSELAVLELQAQTDFRQRMSARDLQWHWMLAINKSRFSPLIEAFTENEKAFVRVEDWVWAQVGPPRAKKFDDLEPDELFAYLADRSWKQRARAREVTEFYFDMRTLQEQARRPAYRRGRSHIREAWARVLAYPFKQEFFGEFQGMSKLREKLRQFLKE